MGLLVISLLGATAWRVRRRSAIASLMLVALAIPLVALAGMLSVPNTFVNGTPAEAGEVDANFDTTEAAVNDLDARTNALETAAQMFLTTNACPAGHVAVEQGYIKLCATGLTTTASSRTLSTPGHAHSHNLQNDQHPGHSGPTFQQNTSPYHLAPYPA